MRATVNGAPVELPGVTPLLAFLAERKLNPAVVVIEHNGQILHRDRWPDTCISDGDTLEILSFVGGG
ncbi:sulfur carrier protein ThiS [Heliobacterium gestii]|uniref:Sulfur carrier protein ThiS n=1 Tax=Heliomicrobium gestii TaxID=2699 RepID=A0A845LBC1_HELGE|nr:sulfur carrier protein ThiS [Heliomicrobium gestii]MBM7867490.1 sulfur carrier protein [Heliomicrobium gestii]MZP43962.1 sulfur carrier protein ThiS [Heliomicrobium gestii]